MKLKKLKIVAFGPYKDEQNIDFTKFSDDSLFLITGDTGSGKTTIFDAISFVLYGDVSGQRKEVKTLKSDFADIKKTCFVELEFEVNNKTYVIKRIPEQLVGKTKGEGLKQQKHMAELKMPDGCIKTNLKEIYSILVDEVLGVDKENFNKLLMLPQGQFQKLLTEKGEDQVNTFRKIFGTTIYEKIANKIFDEKQNIKKEYDLKIYQNEKKIESYVLEEGEEIDKDLIFSEKFKFILQHNEKDKEELKNLDKKIKEKEENLKDIEIFIEKGKRFLEKENEKKELNKRKKELLLNIKDEEEFKRKKEILKKFADLKAYYIFWKEKEEKRKEKKKILEELKEKRKKEEDKLTTILEKFKSVSSFKDELEKLLEKEKEFLVVLNNFNLLKEIKIKANLIEKEILCFRKEKDLLEGKIELKNLFLKIDEKKRINKDIKIFLKTKKEATILKNELKELNERYLESCKNFYEQQASLLAKGLKEGKACPVCGSKCHPAPKKISTKIFLTQKELEDLRSIIFKKKDELNVLYVTLKTLQKDIEKENEISSDLDSFLNSSIKEEIELEKRFNLKKKGLKLNLEKDYEEELVQLNLLYEKKNAKLFEFKDQIRNFLDIIPKELQKESSLKEYEKKLFETKKELQNKINSVEEEKELAEKSFSRLNYKFDQFNLNFLELVDEEEKSKIKFFDMLKKTDEEFSKFLYFYENFSSIKKFVEDFEKVLKEVEEINFKIKAIEKDLSTLKFFDLEDFEKKREEVSFNLAELKRREKLLIKRFAVNTNCIEEINSNLLSIEKLEEEFKVAKILSEVAKGSKKRVSFEKYVLTACLNEVLIFANEWFKKATSNRYFFYSLDFKDCLNFNVFDSYSGKVRHISTLSGGETFAASLSLCLGLCERVCSIAGGIELNTMLIDEGFGTLDSTYLDSVISCLVNLKKEGRQIGIISHIKELKTRINSQILVKKSSDGGSKLFVHI